jgi:RpiR family carbohydrate utilization transcriptional regulator
MSASLLKPGDCLVLISNSGRTRDLLDACEIAHKNRVTTVVITASGSPLAKAGQIHLTADHPESYEKFSPMVSRLLHLLIIDILTTTVALQLDRAVLQPQLRQMKTNLLQKRYS